MVITYEDSEKAVRALYALRESKYEDKHLLGNNSILCVPIELVFLTRNLRFCNFVKLFQ